MERSLRNRLTFGPIMLAGLFLLLWLDHMAQQWTAGAYTYRNEPQGVAGLGLLVLLLIILPGPNVIGYYFLVRTGGHYFSLRGARRGLVTVDWSVQASPALATLRSLVNDPPDAREERVRAVADTLRLEHFASFFQRSATP